MTLFKIESSFQWPLGDPWLKPATAGEWVLVEAECKWDPTDDTVEDVTLAISTSMADAKGLLRVMDEIRGQLRGIEDYAITHMIDEAKKEKVAV